MTKTLEETTEEAINIGSLFAEAGKFNGLNHMLHSSNGLIKRNREGAVEVKISDYRDAKKKVPGFIAQVYNLEMMFPPSISFMGGLLEGKKLELISDLEGENSFTKIATVEYTKNETSARICSKILGYVPEKLTFLIGYAQGSLEKNPAMNRLGLNSYVCSVITAHDFRNLNNVGRSLMAPILEEIDLMGKSYLSTWVDTGRMEKKVNLSHFPGMGFWYGLGYDPLSMEEAGEVIDGLKSKHESSGIEGRKYGLEKMSPAKLNEKLKRNCLTRRLGPRSTKAYDFNEDYRGEFAIIPGHYENGWTGIVMIRDPEKVEDRINNPERYGRIVGESLAGRWHSNKQQ